MKDQSQGKLQHFHLEFCEKYEVIRRHMYQDDTKRFTGKECGCGLEQSLITTIREVKQEITKVLSIQERDYIRKKVDPILVDLEADLNDDTSLLGYGHASESLINVIFADRQATMDAIATALGINLDEEEK